MPPPALHPRATTWRRQPNPALPHSLHPPELMQKSPALHELPLTVPHAETSIGTETSKPETSLPGHLLRERRDRVGLDLAAVLSFERALLGDRLPVAAARTRDYGEARDQAFPPEFRNQGTQASMSPRMRTRNQGTISGRGTKDAPLLPRLPAAAPKIVQVLRKLACACTH